MPAKDSQSGKTVLEPTEKNPATTQSVAAPIPISQVPSTVHAPNTVQVLAPELKEILDHGEEQVRESLGEDAWKLLINDLPDEYYKTPEGLEQSTVWQRLTESCCKTAEAIADLASKCLQPGARFLWAKERLCQYEDALRLRIQGPIGAVIENRRGISKDISRNIFRQKLQDSFRQAGIRVGVRVASLMGDPVTSIPSGRELPSTPAQDIFAASPDYRTVRFQGNKYTLTDNQATIVKYLHEAFKNGTPAVGAHALLSAIEAETSKVRYSFKNSPLWGKLIVIGTRRGTYKLNL